MIGSNAGVFAGNAAACAIMLMVLFGPIGVLMLRDRWVDRG